MTSYDYIIVGAGSAGASLARKLSDLDAGSILVLEAGGDGDREDVRNPTMWPALWGTDIDYAYKTTAQDHAANRVHDWPRGKVVGGTSCLNAMQFIRGHRSDYDGWAAQGNPGWEFDSLLPLFIELEDDESGASDIHGVGGPMHVSRLDTHSPNPVSAAFIEASVQAGYPESPDHNGPTPEGAAWNPTSIKDGVRQDTGRAMLRPVLDRDNLTLRTGASVAKLLIEDARCVGVELVSGEQIHANREVVVASGALDSPRLLQQSGIGSAALLAGLGIDVVEDLPGVGQNLHDHLLLGVVYEAKQPIPVGVNNLSESELFWRSSPDVSGPDIQIAAIHVPFHSAEFTAPANSYTIGPGIVRPKSRGHVEITSAEPGSPLIIDPAYLTDDEDVRLLIEGIAMSRRIGEQPAFDEWRLREVLPGPSVTEEADLREFVAKAASTYYHPAGTCKMGVGADAVVDSRLRVHGISGLRVADLSIVPSLPSANPNATAVLIGWKAAILLAEDSSPAVAEVSHGTVRDVVPA